MDVKNMEIKTQKARINFGVFWHCPKCHYKTHFTFIAYLQSKDGVGKDIYFTSDCCNALFSQYVGINTLTLKTISVILPKTEDVVKFQQTIIPYTQRIFDLVKYVINDYYRRGLKLITVRKIRKIYNILSSERSKINFITRTLSKLCKLGILQKTARKYLILRNIDGGK